MPSLLSYWLSGYLAISLALVTFCNAGHKEGLLVDCLEQIPNFDVVLPTDPREYKNATSVWELKIPREYPVAVVIPSSAKEIQAAVKCAIEAKIRVVPKAGGHSYEGWSVQNGTLGIDLQAMDSVVADKSTGIVTAGPGATLGMLYYHAWFDAGKGINGGTCPPVGLSGFLLGGGFGYYSRRAGMGCDNVVSFDMVDAKGRLLKVSKRQNKDLFWAMCGGGGGNYGVITKWSVKMMDVPDVIQYASVTYADNVDTAAQVADYFQSWASSADANLGSELHVGPNSSAAKLFFFYAGSGSLSDIIDASNLKSLGSSAPKISYKNYTWIDAVVAQAGWGLQSPEQLLQRSWPDEQDYRKEKSHYVFSPGWSTSLYKTLFTQMRDMYPGGNIKFRTSGGKIAAKSTTATAFPWRSALGWVITKGTWGDGSGSKQAAYAWLEKASATIAAAGEKNAAYVNYIDSLLTDWPEAYYAQNYKRLQSIKSKVDPQDMFTYPIQGIVGSKPISCTLQPCVASSS